MSYLYTNKSTKPLNSLLKDLRNEIYTQKFSSIDFSKHRNTIAARDLKQPHSTLLNVANKILKLWELYLRPAWIHRWANDIVCDLIRREDENTSYNCLAPVNKAFHIVAVYYRESPQSPRLAQHLEKILPYLWLSGDGMTSGGTNGVQVWDTAFTVLSAAEAGLPADPIFRKSMEQALKFLELSQLTDNLKDHYRQQRKGGWPFSTKDNGYIFSYCAAEPLKATLLLQEEW